MSEFLRPEVRVFLARYAQALFGGAIMLFGVWWITISFGIMRGLGVAIVVAGLGLLVEGLRRARLTSKSNGSGPGIVEIDERRITWMSGHFGGSIAMDALATVDIQVTPEGEALWVFLQTDGERLVVPASAKGAEKIVDVLSALKGLDYDAALRAMSSDEAGRFHLWRSRQRQLD